MEAWSTCGKMPLMRSRTSAEYEQEARKRSVLADRVRLLVNDHGFEVVAKAFHFSLKSIYRVINGSGWFKARTYWLIELRIETVSASLEAKRNGCSCICHEPGHYGMRHFTDCCGFRKGKRA